MCLKKFAVETVYLSGSGISFFDFIYICNKRLDSLDIGVSASHAFVMFLHELDISDFKVTFFDELILHKELSQIWLPAEC